MPRTYVLSTDAATKKTTRGMSANHPSFEAAKKETEKLAAKADVTSLAVKMRELEARRTAIDEGLISLRPIPRLAPAVIDNRLAEWRRLLRASTTQGRTVLQRIVRGRITFTPESHQRRAGRLRLRGGHAL